MLVTSALPFSGAAASRTHSSPVPSRACGAGTQGPGAAVAGGRCWGWPAVTFASWLRGQGDMAWTNPARAASLGRFQSPQPSGELRGHEGWKGRCGVILLLLPPGIPRGCPVSQPVSVCPGPPRDVRPSPAPHSRAIPPQPPSPSPLPAPPHNPTAGALARQTSDIRGHLGKAARWGLPPRTPTPTPSMGTGALNPKPSGVLCLGSLSRVAAKPAVRACCKNKLL